MDNNVGNNSGEFSVYSGGGSASCVDTQSQDSRSLETENIGQFVGAETANNIGKKELSNTKQTVTSPSVTSLTDGPSVTKLTDTRNVSQNPTGEKQKSTMSKIEKWAPVVLIGVGLGASAVLFGTAFITGGATLGPAYACFAGAMWLTGKTSENALERAESKTDNDSLKQEISLKEKHANLTQQKVEKVGEKHKIDTELKVLKNKSPLTPEETTKKENLQKQSEQLGKEIAGFEKNIEKISEELETLGRKMPLPPEPRTNVKKEVKKEEIPDKDVPDEGIDITRKPINETPDAKIPEIPKIKKTNSNSNILETKPNGDKRELITQEEYLAKQEKANRLKQEREKKE